MSLTKKIQRFLPLFDRSEKLKDYSWARRGSRSKTSKIPGKILNFPRDEYKDGEIIVASVHRIQAGEWQKTTAVTALFCDRGHLKIVHFTMRSIKVCLGDRVILKDLCPDGEGSYRANFSGFASRSESCEAS